MKNQKLISIPLLALGLFAITFSSCKKSTPPPTALTLSSLKSGTVDLNGSVSATGVDPTLPIVATFSTAIDASTATAANITMTNTTEPGAVTLNIAVSGSTITITTTEFGPGTLYQLTFGSGLKATNAQALTTTARTFTTAGAFAPPGALAFWNFDGNVNDGSGNGYNGTALGITYTTGRNAIAGQAASFNGTTSIVQVPNGDALVNSDAWTISFWTNIDTVGHLDSLGDSYNGYWAFGLGFFHGVEVEIHNNFTMGFTFHHPSSDAAFPDGGVAGIYCAFDGTNGSTGAWQGVVYRKDLTPTGGPRSLLNGKWANIVCTYDVATQLVNVYVNGVLMEQDNLTLWPSNSAEFTSTGINVDPLETDIGHDFAMGFGCDLTTTFWQDFSTEFGFYASPYAEHYQGMMDDMRIYHNALTQNEVTLMYNSGK